VDVDADGIADIVAPNQKTNSAHVFFGNGDGSFTPPIKVPAGIRPISVTAADFDADGRKELGFANSTAGTMTTLKTGPAN
jgi:hypothetical protein